MYIILSKRRSAKYRLPTEIYSPLWRIRTLKADGLTTHRERSLSVHCLHSSVLFFLIFRHRCFLLFNFPYHTLPIRETEDTMPLKLFGQAFSINSFQCFFVTVHFMYLANRLTLTGKPVCFLHSDQACPFYSPPAMIYSRQYKKKAILSFVFSLFPGDSLLFYSGLSLFSEIYKMSVL